MSDEEGAAAFAAALSDLLHKLKIPTPAEYGLDRAAFFAAIDKMAEDAMDSGSPSNTRRQPTVEDLKGLYRSLWDEAGF